MEQSPLCWTTVALLPEVTPMTEPEVASLTAQLAAMPREAQADLLLRATKLANQERRYARSQRIRAVSKNLKLRTCDLLTLTQIAGGVTRGYRMLRCLNDEDGLTAEGPAHLFTSVTLPETLLDALPDGSKALGELLCAALTAFRALPATTLSDHVERSAAGDWGARKAKEKTYPTSIRITSAINDQLRAIGRGNVSAGARAVFRWALAQAQAQA